jgi:hypothetical protein
MGVQCFCGIIHVIIIIFQKIHIFQNQLVAMLKFLNNYLALLLIICPKAWMT